MSAAKTAAQRQADREARLKREGLKRVHNLWVHPDDEAAIKALAAKLASKRAKSAGIKQKESDQ